MTIMHRTILLGAALSLCACGTVDVTPTGTSASGGPSGGGGHGGAGATSSSAAGGGGTSSMSSASSSSSSSSSSGFTPGAHTEPPLVPPQGGPVIASPKLITITFANDPNRALAETFGDWVVTSSWLAAAKP